MGVGSIVFDIVTIPSGEGLIGVQMISTALYNEGSELNQTTGWYETPALIDSGQRYPIP